MADPHILYIVSSVVVLALVAWVIAVIAKAPPLPDARKSVETAARGAASGAPPQAHRAEVPAAKVEPQPAEPTGDRASKLDAHLEIQDEKPGEGKTGEG
jgi:hypothetical protein